MTDREKPRHQLIEELTDLRDQVSALKQQMDKPDRDLTPKNVSAQILELLNQSIDEVDVVRDILLLIKGFTGIEAVGLRFQEGDDYPYYESNGFPEDFIQKENSLCVRDRAGRAMIDTDGDPILECMCGNIIRARTDSSLPFFTPNGSFWSNGTTELLASTTEEDRQARTRNYCNAVGYESVALIPLRSHQGNIGLLQLNDHRTKAFTPALITVLERIGENIGIALSRKRAEEELQQRTLDYGKRVKELTCLYGVSNIVVAKGGSIEQALKDSVDQIPPAMQFPEVACARIAFEGREVTSSGFRETPWKLSTDIVSSGKTEGLLEVSYTEEKPMFDEGPFLKEERNLINELARKFGAMIEHKRVEEAIRNSEKNLREAQRVAHVGSWDLNVATGDLYWSDETYRIYGFKPQEFKPTFEKFSSILYPEDKERVRQSVDAALRDGPDYDIDFRFVRPEGEIAWVHCEGEVTRDERGEPIRFFGTQIDITERKRAEEARRESETKYRFLVENLPQKVFLKDAQSTYISCNEKYARDLGIRPEDIPGKTDHDFYPKELAEKYRADDRRIMSVGIMEELEEKYIQAGKEFWVHTVKTPIGGAEGDVTGILGIFWDITERMQAEKVLRETEDQLRQSQKLEGIGRLAGGIAHDFNNMMTVVTGYGEILRNKMERDDPRTENIEEIIKAGSRATDLTRQLLAFSRKQVLKPEPVNLNKVVGNIEKMLRRLLGEDIDIVFKAQPGLGIIQADKSQIEQVLVNLAVNARDAMPNGGKLTVETADVDLDEKFASSHVAVEPGPYAMLAVTDSGCGMDEETRSKLFEPFFTTKGPGKGTGLGLSTVYGIVKQSGGDIWVYSEPGKGTAFKIYLPRVEEKDVVKIKTDQRHTISRGKETILLVEDDAAVRQVTIAMLEGGGFTILEAGDGDEAWRICEGHKGNIDLLLSDVVMPGMSGRELAEQIEKSSPDMKVLFMSGYTDNAIQHHGVLDSETAFIEKPFSPASLTRKIRDVLDGVEGQ
jgi:PAS domain S-box-containing protein